MRQALAPSAAWRSEPGSYVLLLELDAAVAVQVGRLGCATFEPGQYVYFGSALGPGGVAARLGRHIAHEEPGGARPERRVHWHIDYLRPAAGVIGAGAVYGADRLECVWSRTLGALIGAAAPLKGFGSSDCRSGCQAHLWRLPDGLPLTWIEGELTKCPIQMI